ncbi:MAG: hypothetical protein DI589_21400 [Shinella sp.]|nr:MAG: hypothetical protein DI589_21400 [Shinella sp.]
MTLLQFDTQDFHIIGDGGLTLTIPNGKSVTLDLSKITQLDSDFFSKGSFNGSAPSVASGYSISSDGMVYATYENGDMREIAQLLLASVQSPDNLKLLSGNVYAVSTTSGSIVLGQAGEPGFGSVVSGALETSNVDLASELTEMIEAQRSYTANSKVFQTGADLMDVLINLKR